VLTVQTSSSPVRVFSRQASEGCPEATPSTHIGAGGVGNAGGADWDAWAPAAALGLLAAPAKPDPKIIASTNAPKVKLKLTLMAFSICWTELQCRFHSWNLEVI
jgi:hypothetical protein